MVLKKGKGVGGRGGGSKGEGWLKVGEGGGSKTINTLSKVGKLISYLGIP